MSSKICHHLLGAMALLLITAGALAAQTITIQGRVLASSDSTALVGASVGLFDDKGQLTSGVSTESEGQFALQADPQVARELRISSIGYTPITIQIAGDARGVIALGTLYMSEDSQLLDQVVVQGQRSRVDKMLLFPQQAELARSQDFLSLLQTMQLRGLTIDLMNKQASIRGGEVQWQVDGMPRTIQDVQSIDPKRILRIEYSDMLSARYTDRGIGGIVNVILKERLHGGSVWTQVESALTTGFVNGALGARYDRGLHSFTLDYNNGFRDYRKRFAYLETKYIAPHEELTRTETPEASPFGYMVQNLNLSYLYKPSERQQFSATLRNEFVNYHNTSRSEIAQSDSDPFHRESSVKERSYTPALDLYYANMLSNGGKLEVNLVGSYSHGTHSFSLQDQMATRMREVQNSVDVSRTALIGEVVYNHPFSSYFTLATGLQHTTAYSLNKYVETTDNLLENNSYLFANAQGQLGKVQYSIGTGAKLFVVQDATDKKLFVRNQSTLSLFYSPINHLTIVLKSTYLPTLPSLSMLSRVQQRVDDLMRTSGNPDLKAAQSLYNRFGIYYQTNLFTSNLDFSINNTWSPILWDATYDVAGGYFLNRATNGRFNRQYSISWQGGLNNLWNFLTLQGTVRYDMFRTHTGVAAYQLNSLYWNASVMMSYKGWTLGYDYVHPQWTLSGHTKSLGENSSRLMLLYKYRDWSFYASCIFPFTPHGAEYQSETLSPVIPSTSRVYILDNRNMVTVGVAWRLNFGKQLQLIDRTLQNRDSNESVVK